MSFCRIYLLHGIRKAGCICEGCIRLIVDGTEIADSSENDAKSESKGTVPDSDQK